MSSRILPLLFVPIWSTGWVVAAVAAPHSDVLWFLTIRFALAAVAIGLLAIVLRSTWPTDRAAIGHAMVAGVLIHALYLCCVWWAVSAGVPAGVSGILAGVQPVLTALLAPFLLGERTSAIRIAGVGLGTLGIVLVLLPKLVGVTPQALSAIAGPLVVNVVGMLAVTFGAFYQKRFVGGDLVTTTVWQYVGAAVVALGITAVFGTFRFDINGIAAGAMAWSVLVLSVAGVGLFLFLIARGEVARTTAYIFLVPPVSAFFAFVGLGETLSLIQIAGIVVTMVGVYFATRP